MRALSKAYHRKELPACSLTSSSYGGSSLSREKKSYSTPKPENPSPATRTVPYLSHSSAMESFGKEAMQFVCVCVSQYTLV